MPAVTVENPLTLPRMAGPDPTTATDRPVTRLITAPQGFEGEGFPVRRAFAGDLDDHSGPGSTQTPITLAHLTISPGARIRLPWPAGFNGLAYGLSGRGTIGADGQPMTAGQLAVTGPGDVLSIAGSANPDARTDAFDVLVLGGHPIGEPVAHHGPFVMNTRAELIQAIEDHQAGRLGVIPPNAIGIR